jgi:hypothetical protein
MPKKPRASNLETTSARRRLPISKKPVYVKIAPGIRLGYRRNEGPGTWNARVTGPGLDWVKRVGLADDFEPSDGRAVLSYWEAIDAARKLARRQPGDDAGDESRPVTVDEALGRYQADLRARGGDVYNAERSRIHLPGSILSKPVALLGATELKKWRDGLAAKGLSPATVNRTRTCLRAALELAAEHDPHRIANRHAWEVGLKGLPDATEARNVILADGVVRSFIAAAYERDHKLGLLVDIVATTGARPSQVVRLEAADLDLADAKAPRLMMPRSAKGGSTKRAERKRERIPAPITLMLATQLRQETVGRPSDAPLLLRNNGEPWGYRRATTSPSIEN